MCGCNDDDQRTGDGTVDDRSILELDRDGLIVQFHQEPGVINQSMLENAPKGEIYLTSFMMAMAKRYAVDDSLPQMVFGSV